MKISIITSQASGLMSALGNMGFTNFDRIIWLRAPMRIKGMWRAEVFYEH